tara:strand:- start:192 stop:371 length:180 start_codon:yes stop_codon:yes gene_type:complete
MSIQSDLKVIQKVKSNPLNNAKDKKRLINDTLKMVNNYLKYILSDIAVYEKQLKNKIKN